MLSNKQSQQTLGLMLRLHIGLEEGIIGNIPCAIPCATSFQSFSGATELKFKFTSNPQCQIELKLGTVANDSTPPILIGELSIELVKVQTTLLTPSPPPRSVVNY